MYNIKQKLNGEKALAKLGLKLIPTIAPFFEALNGERIILKSGGYSAKFDKVCNEWNAALNLKKGQRAFIKADYSASINFDVWIADSDHGGAYYKGYLYFGEVSRNFLSTDDCAGIFTFKAPDDSNAETYKTVLKTTIKSIESKQAKYEALQAKASAIRASVPYSLQSLIKEN